MQQKDDKHIALRFILETHAVDCFEMIYWPFVFDAIHEGLPHNPKLAAFVRKGLHMHAWRIQKNEDGFYYRHHGKWLMLRSCTRSALVLCGAARRGLSQLLPTNWKNAVKQVMGMMSYWCLETKDVAAQLDLLQDLMEEFTDDP